MANTYYEMMDTMEKEGVNVEYMNGWASGYLHNPRRGEQYLNEAYEAGYSDGLEEKSEGFKAWLQTPTQH